VALRAACADEAYCCARGLLRARDDGTDAPAAFVEAAAEGASYAPCADDG
jgi:hypothetical protein